MSAYYQYSAGSGSGSGAVLAHQVVNLASGTTSQSFTYTNPLSTAIAPIIGAVINTVDALPIFLIPVVTAFSTTGFTVLFNAPPDTANYKLAYYVGVLV